jgi:hypothetical protein
MNRILVLALLCAAFALPAAGAQQLPDLIISKWKAGFCAMEMDEIEVELTIANFGDAGTGFFEITFFLSDDVELDQSDAGIHTFRQRGVLAKKIEDLKVKFRLPSSVKAGSYYIGAILDPKNEIEEVNETNNSCRPTPMQIVAADTPAAALVKRFREELAARDAKIEDLRTKLAALTSKGRDSKSGASSPDAEALKQSLTGYFRELFSGEGPMGQRYAIDDIQIVTGSDGTRGIVACKVLVNDRVEDTGKMKFIYKDGKWEYGGPHE